MLSTKDFLNHIKDIANFGEIKEEPYSELVISRKNSKKIKLDDCIYIEWSTGGAFGGTCWGGKPEDNISPGEDEPEFLSLDSILTHFCPEITFLKYKQFQNLIKTLEYTENEYYGNYTNKKIKYIVVKDLYDKLTELELI